MFINTKERMNNSENSAEEATLIKNVGIIKLQSGILKDNYPKLY